MYERLERNTWYRIFDSVEDLVSTASRVPDRQRKYNDPFERPEFIGRNFTSWDEVYAAARGAWPEGVETIERMAKELESAELPKPVSRKRRIRFRDDDGDELDYDRLRSGQPYWRSSRRESGRGAQTVTIVIDVNAWSGIAHRDILWRGAAAIALTRILEAAGFRTEVWTVHCCDKVYGNGQGHCNAVCLKRPGDPLDVATMSAAVSGWFYRSVMFLAKGIGRYMPTKTLGAPRVPWSRDIDHISRDPQRIVISGTYSYHGAVYLARRALEKLAGIEPPPPPPPPPPSEPAKPLPPPTAKQLAEWRRMAKEWEKQNVEVQP